MSVVINTNTAATIASNNLSASTAMLQKSLNRLSSGSRIVNASDDAGGVAVASRLGAAVKRTAASSHGIANALSFLQNQDSGLKTLSKMVERMNELQSLYKDTTLGADKTNYNTEFTALKSQYESVRTTQAFNGTKLFNDSRILDHTDLSITINEANDTYSLGNIDNNSSTSATGKVPDLSSAAIDEGGNFNLATSSGFTSSAGTSVVINTVTVTVSASALKSTIISEINARSADTHALASLDNDGNLKITGTVSAQTLNITASDLTKSWGLTTDNSTSISASGAGSSSPLVSNAIGYLAGARAKNGADQNVLSYYQELNTSTKANFESAISKIMDVDVAEESTQLARYNTLVQAGTAMIAQANGSTQSALSLLK